MDLELIITSFPKLLTFGSDIYYLFWSWTN